MGKKSFCELMDAYRVWRLIHFDVQNKRNWDAQALFSYIKFSFRLWRKPLKSSPKEMQEFLPNGHTSQNFRSLETLAASARGEGQGRDAHQTSLGKTLFPIAN